MRPQASPIFEGAVEYKRRISDPSRGLMAINGASTLSGVCVEYASVNFKLRTPMWMKSGVLWFHRHSGNRAAGAISVVEREITTVEYGVRVISDKNCTSLCAVVCVELYIMDLESAILNKNRTSSFNVSIRTRLRVSLSVPAL
jgi:hypothetical protein